jgi:nucleolar protein 4
MGGDNVRLLILVAHYDFDINVFHFFQQPKKNPFTLPSILTSDPSSTLAQSLVLHGRTLDVTRAVTREEAGKLKEEGEKRREKADKRNLYLLREGVILPNTPAAESLTPAEIERRTSSFNARRTLLRSNPSLFISKTRLSIRQIPTFVTERVLKRLAVHAVRAFESEVKKGLRTGLTQDELTEVVNEEDGENTQVTEEDGKGKTKAHKKGERTTGVKQAKIVRQHERVDPVTGKGRSKGYGFLEMLKHADALRVLRWTNNNPEVGPLFEKWWTDELEDLIKQEKKKEDKDEARLKRMKDEQEKSGSKQGKGTLIAEFSIENVQVVQRRFALQKDRASTTEARPPLEKIAFRKKTEETPPKKHRLSAGSTKPTPVSKEPVRAGNSIGSLSSKKRKERKYGRKGSG